MVIWIRTKFAMQSLGLLFYFVNFSLQRGAKVATEVLNVCRRCSSDLIIIDAEKILHVTVFLKSVLCLSMAILVQSRLKPYTVALFHLISHQPPQWKWMKLNNNSLAGLIFNLFLSVDRCYMSYICNNCGFGEEVFR